MHRFAIADWVIIIGFILAVLVLGLWLGRGQANTRDYFLGNRNIPWWGVALSIVATETSALTFLGVPAISFGSDLAFIQIIFGYVLARVVLAVVLVPHYFKGDIYSPYQLIEGAFGMRARHTAGIFFLIAGMLAAGVRVYVTCIPVQLIFGLTESQIIIAIFMFVGLALIYTWVGGVKSVIWTDVVQFFVLAGGGIFTAFYVVRQTDGGWATVTQLASDAGKWNWFHGEFSFSAPYNIWMGLLGATFQVMSSHGVDQLNVQRVLACRNMADGRKALLFSAVIIFPLMLLFLLVGTLLWAFYQLHPFQIELPESQPGMAKNDYIFPIFILTEMPSVLKGLLVVAIFSAALSSVSSALSALSSVSIMDLIRTRRPDRYSEKGWLAVSRKATLLWGVVLVGVAWWSKEAKSVLTLAFSLNGLTAGAMLGAMGLALWWKKGGAFPVIFGMIASFGLMLFVRQLEWTVQEGGSLVSRSIYWPWFTLIGTFACLFCAWAVRRLVTARNPKFRCPSVD